MNMNMNLTIKCISEISFSTRAKIVEQYCKQFQTFKEEYNDFAGFHYKRYSLTVHKKNPTRICLEDSHQQYWVKCYKTKTSYVFDIWYA